MAISVDHNKAEEILLAAYREKCQKKDFITESIEKILTETHKTYKYILINAILAKATNEKINPIALQAGAPLEGAFDARSLCHKVLVPFERDFLRNSLGGSNEPFLNKPARFTHLSKKNAVRKGRDKQTLLSLIEILKSIKTSIEAKQYLACALEILKKQIKKKRSELELIEYSPDLVEIYEFAIRFIKKSFEGETSAIIVGTLESLIHKYMNSNFKVITHKVNQSGASSKEIGDIDIYKEDEFYYSIEVKDKDFNEYDIEHAFNKVLKHKGEKAAFIYGIHANSNINSIQKIVSSYSNYGMFVVVQDIITHIKNILFRLPKCTKNEFVVQLIDVANSINCKEETKNWIEHLFFEMKWSNKKLGQQKGALDRYSAGAP